MANETISFAEFSERALEISPEIRNRHDGNDILTSAWEECAWLSTLTDDRVKTALGDRLKVADLGNDPVEVYKIENSTRITVSQDGDVDHVTTFAVFSDDNDLSLDEIEEIRADLALMGVYVGGGGASLEFILRVR